MSTSRLVRLRFVLVRTLMGFPGRRNYGAYFGTLMRLRYVFSDTTSTSMRFRRDAGAVGAFERGSDYKATSFFAT